MRNTHSSSRFTKSENTSSVSTTSLNPSSLLEKRGGGHQDDKSKDMTKTIPRLASDKRAAVNIDEMQIFDT